MDTPLYTLIKLVNILIVQEVEIYLSPTCIGSFTNRGGIKISKICYFHIPVYTSTVDWIVCPVVKNQWKIFIWKIRNTICVVQLRSKFKKHKVE